jgi:uncharacterized membrane protein
VMMAMTAAALATAMAMTTPVFPPRISATEP